MVVLIIIIVIVVVLLAFGLWLGYNGLVRKRNRTQEAWSEIDIELKRRHDLIPNLVSTVQGYAAHEQGTFEAVTQARANAVSVGATGDPAKIAPAENALTGALRSLFAVAENYPQLRAVESFLQLQETLTATEDKIEAARRGAGRQNNHQRRGVVALFPKPEKTRPPTEKKTAPPRRYYNTSARDYN